MTRRSFLAGLFRSAVATVAGSRPGPPWKWKRPVVRGSYTVLRQPLSLEPAGVDWDGSIKPIRELRY